MPAGETSATRSALATIATASGWRPNDRGLRCRHALVAKTRDRTRAIPVIVLLLLRRCKKRAAALSARERPESIPTWKQALAVWEFARVAIMLKIRDDRTLRNPSPLDFVETCGGTNANESLLARCGDREWRCPPIWSGIRSDRQSGSLLGCLVGASYLHRRRSDGGRAGYSKESQFH